MLRPHICRAGRAIREILAFPAFGNILCEIALASAIDCDFTRISLEISFVKNIAGSGVLNPTHGLIIPVCPIQIPVDRPTQKSPAFAADNLDAKVSFRFLEIIIWQSLEILLDKLLFIISFEIRASRS